jgi:hypothetical protein
MSAMWGRANVLTDVILPYVGVPVDRVSTPHAAITHQRATGKIEFRIYSTPLANDVSVALISLHVHGTQSGAICGRRPERRFSDACTGISIMGGDIQWSSRY